ncbi:MAG: peptidylprolyl isomerase [Balneolaceae bacterium]|nr:peptidylprolyl isomerase [Balneolaceae bacterium]MBO6546195.1 peptidylprolyl isomerase [Balneolaceae bacterium]MBO6648554.1 peptidylprolyl isomerase [Balneolaceae bacterium]
MRIVCVLSSIVLVSCAGSSTTTTSPSGTPPYQIVGEVGSQQVSYKELTENFANGSLENELNLDELRDFLPIYLDYKAKLMAAKEDGYYEDERILSEFEVYAKQAAYSYWLENKIRPTLFEEFKSRYIYELKSSHVLMSMADRTDAADTMDVYTKMIEARDKYLAGTSTMAELNEEYSSTTQGRKMGGELPWFGIGTTVKPFEDVLYSLEIGEISMPFRTQFGYHIVLLEDKREKQPGREVSHIFIRRDSSPAALDSAFKELEHGALWSEVVKEYTEDTPSASNGGKIGWVNYGARYDGAFIDSVMNLNPEIKYSKPFSSVYGYHIVKLDSIQTFEDEKARDEFIMSELEKSRSFRKSNSFIVDWLSDNYRETEHQSTLTEIIRFLEDTDSVALTDIDMSADLASKPIYSFNGDDYSSQEYYDYLVSSGKLPLTNGYSTTWYNDFKEFIIDSRLTDMAVEEFPDFSSQLENYKNGLAVYQINEDYIWSAATVDTSRLMEMYSENPDEYSYDTRYYYHLITSSRDTSLQKAIDFINSGNHPDSLRSFNINVGVVSDSTGAFRGDPFTKLESMEEQSLSEVFDYNNRKAFFYLNEIFEPRKMTFEESFNKLLADFQPVREQEWLNDLRSTYNVKLYTENLKKAFEEEQSPE